MVNAMQTHSCAREIDTGGEGAWCKAVVDIATTEHTLSEMDIANISERERGRKREREREHKIQKYRCWQIDLKSVLHMDIINLQPVSIWSQAF